MKKLILLAVTVLALFSCSNENDGSSLDSGKNVVVQFAPARLTRAVDGAVASDSKADISNYTIFFLDAAGNVVKGTTSGLVNPNGSAVPCQHVGETAVSVYVIANANSVTGINLSGITPENNSTLADIKKQMAAVSTQKTISNVVLANSSKTGNGKIEITTSADGSASYAANVEISPAICRLEIGKVCGTGDITGYKLEGVYIDGHAVKFTVGGEYDKTGTDTNIKAGIYSVGVGTLNNYPSDFCDVSQITAVETNSEWIAAPTDAKVWAYQLAAGAPMPKIVIKLSAVNGDPADKYVTVTSYKQTGETAAYTQLVAGTVYKVEKISFEVKNTAEVPNATEKDVSVTVTVKAWDVVNLEPSV